MNEQAPPENRPGGTVDTLSIPAAPAPAAVSVDAAAAPAGNAQTPEAAPVGAVAAGGEGVASPEPKRRIGRKQVLIAAGVLLLAGTSGAAGWILSRPEPPKPAPKAVPVAAPAPKPEPKLSLLTGAEVTPAQAGRPVTAVMIENSPDARPQSALQSAGVVYEALAEGGVTRFMALYQDQRPAKIGPVRSLRPYYIDWALEYGAPIAHAGGSHDALTSIKPLGVKSMNALNIGAPFYRASDRYAPHNLYISSDGLDSLESRFGWAKPSTAAPWKRKADAPSSPAAHPHVRINYSSYLYQAEYRYDAGSNSYVRYMAGRPHIDRETGKPIRAKNVVVEYVPLSYKRLGKDTYASFPTQGTGKAIVFRDGTAVVGTWNKASRTGRTIFKDTTGQEIPLNVGNTWIGVVPSTKPVAY